MRNLTAEPRLHLQERAPLGRRLRGIGVIAAYLALAIIAAIVFGSLSVHPFH